jgi:hypothetical protein
MYHSTLWLPYVNGQDARWLGVALPSALPLRHPVPSTGQMLRQGYLDDLDCLDPTQRAVYYDIRLIKMASNLINKSKFINKLKVSNKSKVILTWAHC